MDDDVTKLYDRGSLYPPKATPPEPDGVKRVGRHELKEKLGDGAVAAVCMAFDPKIDRTLAIKLLNPSFCQQPEHRARFVRESKDTGLLSHLNTVTVFDVGEDGEQPYIAVELVEGITLAGYLKEHEADADRGRDRHRHRAREGARLRAPARHRCRYAGRTAVLMREVGCHQDLHGAVRVADNGSASKRRVRSLSILSEFD